MSTPTASTSKLTSYDFYNQVLGKAKYIVAPMVDQSELAWRILSRRYGAQVIYTPMINAKMFHNAGNTTYRVGAFDLASGEEGNPTLDRPLVVQFCANNPDQLLESAKVLEDHCDAVDINLGCPQEIAKKGRYGAFLQDDWELIYKLINTLHVNLKIPVTAKFRVFPTVEKTVEYAKMLERAGAQIITCHGRVREQRGTLAGLADWAKIRAVKEAVSIPVFANGNILYQSDIEDCLRETGADGVMSAEGQLYNAALFANASSSTPPLFTPTDINTVPESITALHATHPPHADLALEYLDIVQSIKTRTSISAIKGHLFKIMRPALSREKDLRDRLGKIVIKKNADLQSGVLKPYVDVCAEMKVRMDRDAKEVEGKPLKELITVDSGNGLVVLPHWLAQPYWRALPAPKMEEAAQSIDTSKRHIEEPTTSDEAPLKRPRLEEVVVTPPTEQLILA